MVDRTWQPVSDSADFPGPILALWTSGGNSATAVVHDLRTEKYAAYAVTVVCAN
jgi:hypothetical protein